MPTLHIVVQKDGELIDLSGGSVPRIEALRLIKYTMSQTTEFSTTGVYVGITWMNIGLHNTIKKMAHELYLPVRQGEKYTSELMNVEVETSSQYLQSTFDVALKDAAGEAYVPTAVAGQPAASFELNLWFDYVPSY